jgi:hypothetical protein
MMLIPHDRPYYWFSLTMQTRAPFFMYWDYPVDMTGFILQTVFAAVLFAVLVNLFPRRPRQ